MGCKVHIQCVIYGLSSFQGTQNYIEGKHFTLWINIVPSRQKLGIIFENKIEVIKNYQYQKFFPYFILLKKYLVIFRWILTIKIDYESQILAFFDCLALHSGYLYYIDGYKKWNRLSQTTVIDIKITAIKNAIEWH